MRHQSAECGWGSVKSKWHAGELEQPATGAESGAFLGNLSHTELPISIEKVECVLLKLTTERQKASCGAFSTAELLAELT